MPLKHFDDHFFENMLWFELHIVWSVLALWSTLLETNASFCLLWRKLADKVAAAGFFVAVPELLKGDPYKPEDASRPIQVWLKDHGTVGSSLWMRAWWSFKIIKLYSQVSLSDTENCCCIWSELTFLVYSGKVFMLSALRRWASSGWLIA